MASESREMEKLQEVIVRPLMEMMRTLSGEMRRNLREEVSSIRLELDKVDKKLSRLINRMEGNNIKGEQINVRDSVHRWSAESWESESYSVVTGRPPTEFHMTDQPIEEDPQIQPAEKDSGIFDPTDGRSDKDLNQRDVTNIRKYEMMNRSPKKVESHQMPAETKVPYSAMNGYTSEQGEESETVEIETTKAKDESDHEIKVDKEHTSSTEVDKVHASGIDIADIQEDEKVLGKEDKERLEEKPTNEDNLHAENDINVCRATEDPGTHFNPQYPVTKNNDQPAVTTTHRLLNFGIANPHKRPKSPPPPSSKKENVPYANFKKMKTTFTDDNRKTYLQNVVTVLQSDVGKDRPSEVNENKVKESESMSSSKENDEMTIKPESNEGLGEHDIDPTQDERNSNNNQQVAPSGFKNEHGDEDNRFLAAAHEEVPHAAVRRRSEGLSNLQLVKNGPRLPLKSKDTKTLDLVSSAAASGGGSVDGLVRSVSSMEKEEIENLVDDDVLYSLIEGERISAGECSDLKSQGIDTVICLDTSSSMEGLPIRTAVDTIRKLIDGFENNAIYSDLEENVSIVTFGKENKIVCHLTNDYSLLRDSLESITTGGPSPLWLGLALSLAEIKERGGACKMDPMTVLPRIILVTDGYASRKNLLKGNDSSNVDSQVLREILSLLDTCRSFTSYMQCITLGPCQEDILKTLTDDRMYTVVDVEHLIEFFKVQERANSLVKDVMEGRIGRNKIYEAVQNSHLGTESKDELQCIIVEALKKVEETSTEEPEQQEPSTETAPSSVDKIDDDVKSPMFGAAVVPNPDWVGFPSRQNFTGTVIGTRKKGLVKILWSDGTAERCKYGVNGEYDFLVSEDQSVDCSEVRIGSMVTRGKDWRWKNQDGGEGNVGVVMKKEGPVIHVIWPHGGQGNYRYGYNKKYDLKLSETRHTEGTHPVWFMEEQEGRWCPLPPEVSQSIEQMFQTDHTGTFLVQFEEKSLRISINYLQARDTSTQAVYSIERRELSQEEWLPLCNEQ